MRRGEGVTTLFTFLLIGAFTLLCLLVVVLGGRVYAAVADGTAHNAALRTSVCYVASKVRASDRAVAVSVDTAHGLLTLTEEHKDVAYTTYIYAEDGGLYEYFARADRPFSAELGERIAQAEAFDCTLSPEGLLCLHLTQDAQTYTLHMQLQGGYR